MLPTTFTWDGVSQFYQDFLSNSVIQNGLYAMVALGIAGIAITVVKRFGK